MTDSGHHYPDEELDLTPPPVGAQYHPAETEDLLLTLRDMIESARDVPLSASSMISKEEALALLDDALHVLPEELRAARWLLKEREEFLARTRHEAREILEQARGQADRMVERTEVVKAAESRAYEILETAEADARRLRHEVEDFCDQKLASFEIVLERTQKLVAAGRAKLQGTNLLAEAAAAAEHGFEGPVAVAPSPSDQAHGQQPSLYDDAAADQWQDQPQWHDDASGGWQDPTAGRWQDESAGRWQDPAPGGWSDPAGTDRGWDDDGAWDDEEDDIVDPPLGRPRLTVVDDRYAEAPPSSVHPTRAQPSGRSGGSNFFDQDLS